MMPLVTQKPLHWAARRAAPLAMGGEMDTVTLPVALGAALPKVPEPVMRLLESEPAEGDEDESTEVDDTGGDVDCKKYQHFGQ